MNSNKKTSIFFSVLFVILVTLFTAAILNRQFLSDYFRGIDYTPSSEMAKIRSALSLTSRGDFLFKASHPELNTADDFNNNCDFNDDESAILGCYSMQNIYVYNITEERLNGIRELTTAHELLHAAYERLSIDEKDVLRPYLEAVYRDNQVTLKDEIENYSTVDQLEEIYVRAGTEIKDLPADLEKHYAEIFQDQDKIVSFYDSYIKVFRAYEAELDNLSAKMKELGQEIDSETTEYEKRFNQLEADIISFNSCANVEGCFKSNAAFYERRNQLLAEQSSINALYDQIDVKIKEYNNLVEQYNNNVIESNNLQNIINSHTKAKGI